MTGAFASLPPHLKRHFLVFCVTLAAGGPRHGQRHDRLLLTLHRPVGADGDAYASLPYHIMCCYPDLHVLNCQMPKDQAH